MAICLYGEISLECYIFLPKTLSMVCKNHYSIVLNPYLWYITRCQTSVLCLQIKWLLCQLRTFTKDACSSFLIPFAQPTCWRYLFFVDVMLYAIFSWTLFLCSHQHTFLSLEFLFRVNSNSTFTGRAYLFAIGNTTTILFWLSWLLKKPSLIGLKQSTLNILPRSIFIMFQFNWCSINSLLQFFYCNI